MKCYYFGYALPHGQTLLRVTRIQWVLNFNHVGGKTDTLALCFRPHNIMFSFSFFGSLHLTEFFYFLFLKCYSFGFALPLGQTRLRVTRMQTVLTFFPLYFLGTMPHMMLPDFAVMAEWLRRWTWNPMGSPRAGSNPSRSVLSLRETFSRLGFCSQHFFAGAELKS